MAYDIRSKPGDSDSSREGNPLLVGARAKQHQDYMTMETSGALEAGAQCTEYTRGENWLSQVHQRQQALTSLYSICNETVREEAFSSYSFCRLFFQENVLNLLFQLFDQKSTGQLIQSDFIESIQMKLGKDGNELVNLLDTLCYVFVNEADLDILTFCRIWQSKGVLAKLFSIIDVDKSGKLPVTQLMAFINELTQAGALFILIEGTRKLRFRWTGKGRSFISSAVLLPSRVTHLVVRKPPNFNANPGDYVFVKIPAIASNEWHPFTISSAPELQGWTNKLYEYFKVQQAKLCLQQKNSNTRDVSEPVCHHCKCVMGNTTSSETQRIVRSVRRLTQKWMSPTKDGADEPELLHLYYQIQDPNNGTELPSSSVLDIPPISQLLPCPQYWTSLNQTQTPCPSGERIKEKSFQDNPEFGARGRRDIYSYLRHRPGIMSIYVPEDDYLSSQDMKCTDSTTIKISPRASYAPESITKKTNQVMSRQMEEVPERVESQNVTYKRNVHIYHPLEIAIAGPYGAPSSHIFRAQHAVLIAAGIGVTPFASILQSIMHRYYSNKNTCPKCKHSWGAEMPDSIMSLQKVHFFWINRDQRSFEWFVDLLSQLEMEQAEMGGVLNRFLDLHMYITSALKKTDMKAVGLQMALDLLHAKEKRDLVTGLKTRTIAGRPNWDKVFQKLADENKGKVTVFYRGPRLMAKELNKKCNDFGFKFCKEIF